MEARKHNRRVVIEAVEPEIDCGRFPVKRISGDEMTVEADIFTDGHDLLSAVLLHRRGGDARWEEAPMEPLANDRWRGSFPVTAIGRYRYTLQAWVDPFRTWRRDLEKKVAAGQEVGVELQAGAGLVAEAAARARGMDAESLGDYGKFLTSAAPREEKVEKALSPQLTRLMAAYPERRFSVAYPRELEVVVDRKKARFSTWYEMFPRSCSKAPGRHGTFKDCEERLSEISRMGFDVLYLPPIHPIGRTHRKGNNNQPAAGPGDPGSPWAIGAEEGGHKTIHPRLGTLEDFRQFLKRAKDFGIEVALDIAFQCSPDHPYVKEQPEWFRRRPDGTVQYAENPPKKYEDIYPLDFECEQREALWEELRSVVAFWVDQGVRIFRADNPHTKPFAFWEWMIGEIKQDHPEVIFLSEAFTRPKVMYRLAKLGFTQSYTYFTWRNVKWEINRYFTELTRTDVCEYFGPNLWPNTPDILTEYLQMGGRPGFMARLVLAATLGSSYGIYGPAFELCESRPREAGSEEYLDSEKYGIRSWDLDNPVTLRDFIGRVNRIRRENPALHQMKSLRFHQVDNDQLICFSKHTKDRANIILVVVNLDPHHKHSGWLELPVTELDLDPLEPYQVHDLLSDARYLWYGNRNYVEIDPHVVPAHLFRLRRRVRTERDFDYYL